MNLDVLNNQHSDEIAAFLAVASQGSFVGASDTQQSFRNDSPLWKSALAFGLWSAPPGRFESLKQVPGWSSAFAQPSN